MAAELTVSRSRYRIFLSDISGGLIDFKTGKSLISLLFLIFLRS